jgi:hypothetical protein
MTEIANPRIYAGLKVTLFFLTIISPLRTLRKIQLDFFLPARPETETCHYAQTRTLPLPTSWMDSTTLLIYDGLYQGHAKGFAT